MSENEKVDRDLTFQKRARTYPNPEKSYLL